MMKPAAGQTGQVDCDRLDIEDASFDGDSFQDFGMEFGGHEDLVNTFIDTEAPAVIGGASRNESSQDAVPVEDDLDTSTSSSQQKNKAGVFKGPSRRKKRPKGKPRRPLCGYNIFFQKHSKEIQATTLFKDLGKIMGERWKALTDEEKAVYEKEAEKDVVRFRREMDIYEKKRKERLCPPFGSPSKDDNSSIMENYRTDLSQASRPNFQVPPGWSAAPASSFFGGFVPSATPLPNSSTFIVSGDHGPPPLPSPGLHVPGQFVGPMPNSAALPRGAEISLPDATGATRKYRVVYACYRMTQQEANEYMARFAAATATATPQPFTVSSLPQTYPPRSPRASRPTFFIPAVPPSPHNTPR